MNYIDLHVHSTCSDGTYTPTELVEYAIKKKLSAFALTDHDTTAGLEEAFLAANDRIEIIPGIELSTEYQGRDIHIVGLDFDYQSEEFQSRVRHFQDSRHLRNQKMIDLLKAQGFDISWDSMYALYGDSIWTRVHFAKYLVLHGYAADIRDAFNRYLGDTCPCYVPREKVTPLQAVRLIRRAGGIPILAHPLIYHLPEEKLLQLVSELKEAGLIGIETLYSTHSPNDEQYVRRLARTNGLCISGGSDFHGENKPTIDLGCGKGNLKITYDILKQMRAAK